MKPRIHAILGDAIERGIEAGMRRAYKHTDTPTQDQIMDKIHAAIWENIYQVFEFDEVKE